MTSCTSPSSESSRRYDGSANSASRISSVFSSSSTVSSSGTKPIRAVPPTRSTSPASRASTTAAKHVVGVPGHRDDVALHRPRAEGVQRPPDRGEGLGGDPGLLVEGKRVGRQRAAAGELLAEHLRPGLAVEVGVRRLAAALAGGQTVDQLRRSPRGASSACSRTSRVASVSPVAATVRTSRSSSPPATRGPWSWSTERCSRVRSSSSSVSSR